MTRSVSVRSLTVLIASTLSAALLLAACGTDDDAGPEGATPGGTQSADAPGADVDASDETGFPVTVDTVYGAARRDRFGGLVEQCDHGQQLCQGHRVADTRTHPRRDPQRDISNRMSSVSGASAVTPRISGKRPSGRNPRDECNRIDAVLCSLVK